MRDMKFHTGLYSLLLLAIATSAAGVIWGQVISTDTALEQSVTATTVIIPPSVEQESADASISEGTLESENSVTDDSATDEVVHIDAEPEVTPVIKGTEEAVSVISEPEVKDIVTISINGGATTEVPFTSGMTVHEAMTAASADGAFTYTTSEFSGLGVFVEAINGVGDDGSNKNWIFRVNGKLASVGASGYSLQAGDQISWTYEKNY